MMQDKCKICRRAGQKLFLKGDRCFSPKCALVKRPNPPGPERKRRRGAASEYKRALNEKQKLRNWYGLSEKQLRKYVNDILEKRSKFQNIGDELIKRLESRLDSVVLRMGFAKSRKQARQMVSHAYFAVNNKAINVPSFTVKKDNVITLKENKKKKTLIAQIAPLLKKKEIPSWIEMNKDTMVGKFKGEPTLAEVMPPAEIPTIFEFYSR